MPRVRVITLDNLQERISPFTYDETEEYIKTGQEMIKREPPPDMKEWESRTLETVCFTLNKAKANGAVLQEEEKWTPAKLRKEYDMGFINFIYTEFMKMSGLRAPEPGENQATSTSR
jgi:hypothetical protein